MELTENIEQLKYPIGKFNKPAHIDAIHTSAWISSIEALPSKLADAVASLDQQQLDTPYRPGGWTVRQVVHHLADSHMNAFTRFKLALTEESPMVRPYLESKFAELPDSLLPPKISLDLLYALHQRWSVLLHSLDTEQLKRTYVHPEYKKTFSLDEAIGMYEWHGEHHLAHIMGLKRRMKW